MKIKYESNENYYNSDYSHRPLRLTVPCFYILVKYRMQLPIMKFSQLLKDSAQLLILAYWIQVGYKGILVYFFNETFYYVIRVVGLGHPAYSLLANSLIYWIGICLVSSLNEKKTYVSCRRIIVQSYHQQK